MRFLQLLTTHFNFSFNCLYFIQSLLTIFLLLVTIISYFSQDMSIHPINPSSYLFYLLSNSLDSGIPPHHFNLKDHAIHFQGKQLIIINS